MAFPFDRNQYYLSTVAATVLFSTPVRPPYQCPNWTRSCIRNNIGMIRMTFRFFFFQHDSIRNDKVHINLDFFTPIFERPGIIFSTFVKGRDVSRWPTRTESPVTLLSGLLHLFCPREMRLKWKMNSFQNELLKVEEMLHNI